MVGGNVSCVSTTALRLTICTVSDAVVALERGADPRVTGSVAVAMADSGMGGGGVTVAPPAESLMPAADTVFTSPYSSRDAPLSPSPAYTALMVMTPPHISSRKSSHDPLSSLSSAA